MKPVRTLEDQVFIYFSASYESRLSAIRSSSRILRVIALVAADTCMSKRRSMRKASQVGVMIDLFDVVV